MLRLNGDISGMVFNHCVTADFGEVSLDSDMLSVLMELDGRKNIGEIAFDLNKNLQETISIVQRLSQLDLIEQVPASKPQCMDKELHDFLVTNLQLSMGPIAEVLVEDEMREMGEAPDEFPMERVGSLVNLLARQIPRDEKRIPFQQVMAKKLVALI